jgi:hypothetical protein
MILAIDPGPEQSAWVKFDGEMILGHGKASNDVMVDALRRRFRDIEGDMAAPSRCVIEQIASYGMAVGAEVFETCVFTGRFMEAFGPERCDRLPRIKVKNHLCHSSRANDANIRQAIIDRFGGKERAIGKKAAPGPLYGIAGDEWAALAVALTWWDQNAASERS